MADEGREMTPDEILQAGGCRSGKEYKRNGETWHPRIPTIGLMPCISSLCRVSDGVANKLKNASKLRVASYLKRSPLFLQNEDAEFIAVSSVTLMP